MDHCMNATRFQRAKSFLEISRNLRWLEKEHLKLFGVQEASGRTQSYIGWCGRLELWLQLFRRFVSPFTQSIQTAIDFESRPSDFDSTRVWSCNKRSLELLQHHTLRLACMPFGILTKFVSTVNPSSNSQSSTRLGTFPYWSQEDHLQVAVLSEVVGWVCATI